MDRGGPQRIPRPPHLDIGGPPPWAPLIGTDPGLGIADVRTRLAASTVDRSLEAVEPGRRRSAVAVLLSGSSHTDDVAGNALAGSVPGGNAAAENAPGGLEVLLTRRSWNMRTHRGEVSFAGGSEDPGDRFPIGTALREAHEEIGLDPGLVEVVGALLPLTTFTSDRVVVPIVGVTETRPILVAAPAEVDAILHVSLADLLHPDCYHEERWSWGNEMSGAGIAPVTDHPMHFFDLPGDTIWGATAAMLHHLLSLLLADVKLEA